MKRTRGRPRKLPRAAGQRGRKKLHHNTIHGFRYSPKNPSSFKRKMRPRRTCVRDGMLQDDISICQCTTSCDDACLNRLSLIQCDFSVCRVKRCTNNPHIDCGNQPFGRAGTEESVKRESAGPKGQGLFAGRRFLNGEFVIEYVGRVLTNEEWNNSVKVGPHNYSMELDEHRVIDSTDSDHQSRFINHSCDPNMECQRWIVSGEDRIGFFAITDIKVDSELTFNYRYASVVEDECHCGAPNCRGWLG